MARVTVFEMTTEHVPAVLAIEAKCNPAPWSEASFRSELGNPQAHYTVALAGSKLVGYCGCWDVIDEVHVTNIGVDPDFRRQGAGRQLMTHMLAVAVDRGMRCSTLEVRAGNAAAILLYEALGYEKCAIRRGYYPNDRENAVVMWLYNLRSRAWST